MTDGFTMKKKTIVDAFDYQVSSRPDAIAVIHNEDRWSYDEVNKRAEEWQTHIRIQNGNIVLLDLERKGIEIIAATLAVWRARGGVMAIDTSIPEIRKRVLLKKVNIAATISSYGYEKNTIREEKQYTRIIADECLAYIVGTSGSTGAPKPIAYHHDGLLNLLEWQQKSQLPVNEGLRVLQLAPLAFDVSYQETWSTLAYGGTLVLASDTTRNQPDLLTSELEKNSVNYLYVTPQILYTLAAYCQHRKISLPSLKAIISAGEQLILTKVLRDWFKLMPGCRLHNHYGPSETHVVAAHVLEDCPERWPTLAPIGRPIDNVHLNVLGSSEEGELVIAGTSVGLGYVGETSNESRFFLDNQNIKNYRSGDIVKKELNDLYYFLRREDRQVKIRGFRVELQEIEMVLGQHKEVLSCYVDVRTRREQPEMIAWIVLCSSTGETKCHRYSQKWVEFLKDKLPHYMIPIVYVLLPRFPMTESNKIANKELPIPRIERPMNLGPIRLPKSEKEYLLVERWKEVLGIDDIGIDDNFFSLGGNSLMVLDLVKELEKISVYIKISDIYSTPTIAKLALKAVVQVPVPTKAGGYVSNRAQRRKVLQELRKKYD